MWKGTSVSVFQRVSNLGDQNVPKIMALNIFKLCRASLFVSHAPLENRERCSVKTAQNWQLSMSPEGFQKHRHTLCRESFRIVQCGAPQLCLMVYKCL